MAMEVDPGTVREIGLANVSCDSNGGHQFEKTGRSGTAASTTSIKSTAQVELVEKVIMKDFTQNTNFPFLQAVKAFKKTGTQT